MLVGVAKRMISCAIHHCWLLLFIAAGTTATAQDSVRIAFIGNSITYGSRVTDRERNSFPARIDSMLGDKYVVGNFGASGATLLNKGNHPYTTTQSYRDALAFKPDRVFIKLGTNDTKPINRIHLAEFVNDYKQLIVSFRELESRPEITLLLPTPVFSDDSASIYSKTLREEILPKVREVAYETGCEVLNLYNFMIGSPDLFPDKVHPSAAGCAKIAERLYQHILKKADTAFTLSRELPAGAKAFNFHGFSGYEFSFRNRNAKIVVPHQADSLHQWVWRARFWGHEPQADIALLERGFHIVYCDVAELFGNEEALSIWDDYYRFLIGTGLAKKAVMEGMSRGGVYIYRWAVRYPERVAAIYADAPVLDLKSWPGGKGAGKGDRNTWETFKKDFDLATDEAAIAFKGNPLDLTRAIAAAGFPMLHVVGDADDVVPVSENTAPFEKNILADGGSIRVIHKPGVGHHPHSLQDPQPIVDFVLEAIYGTQGTEPLPPNE